MMDEIESKAQEAVRENRVKMYVFKPSNRRLWVVVGRHGLYMVLPDSEYCTCNDFFFRVIGGEKPTCYHLLAVKRARREGKYTVIEKDDGLYRRVLETALGSGEAGRGD